MVILHIITNLGTGGAELMLKRLVEAHGAAGHHRHEVISLMEKGTVGPAIEAYGVKVTALHMRHALLAPRTLLRLRALIRKRQPDIVQTWMHHADLIGGLAARAAGVKRIIWGVRIAEIGHRMGTSRLTVLIRRLCAMLSHKVPSRIVYVAHSARRVHERVGYAPEKAVVIPNGYVVPATIDRDRLRRELGLPADAFLIGSAGRFNAQKDHRSFVRAAAHVAEHSPQARFVLIGRGLEWTNSELAGWVTATGHGDRFCLLGEQPDLVRLLGGLDLFCLHSVSEGFPNVVAEAMSAGVSCVVTDVGDAAYLVGDTGSVIPPSRPTRLATAILDAIGWTPAERVAKGSAARQRVIDNFSMAAITRRWEELYASFAEPAETAKGQANNT